MAFSTAQEQYINDVCAAFLKQHPESSYIAWNTQTSDYNKYDLHIIFSDDVIFSSDYIDEFENGAYFFTCTGTVYQYDIISGNISGYNPDYSNRIKITELSLEQYNIAIPAYNTVSTNCDWLESENGIQYPLAGDIILSEGVYHDVVQSNIQTYSLGIIGLLILFVLFFSWAFGKRS